MDAVVVTDLYNNQNAAVSIKRIGEMGAAYLDRILQDGDRVGLSWGRTMHQLVSQMKPERPKKIQVVQLVGSSTEGYATELETPTLVQEMAKAYQGAYALLYAPMYIENDIVRKELMKERVIQSTLEKIRSVNYIVTGIADVATHERAVTWMGFLSENKKQDLIRKGAVGYMCGYFFDKDGQKLNDRINDRIIGIQFDEIMRVPNVIAVAGGIDKTLAIHAAIKGKLVNRLITDSRIAETVIRVDRRMTYTAVNRILTEQDPALMEEYGELVPMFFLMKELSELLRRNRSRRGAIDFEFPESKIYLNRAGRPVDVRPYEQNVATRLIEDFMLLANETVARTYCRRELPFLYRTHENPDMEKMEGVLSFIRRQGIRVEKAAEEITPGEIQKILQQIAGTPQEPLISRLLLRSMKQARYTTGCSGHFGLAARYYCHFTSPIRRYPDLQIHRIIKDDLRGRMTEEKIAWYASRLEGVAEQSSAAERRAEEAERETDKMKMAEYMLYHIGEIYDGVISGVTGWGFYVELPNTIEGLVHVSSLEGDYFVFDEENYRLTGEITRREYSLGQKVRVRVAGADVENRTIDFVLAGEEKDE